MLSIWRVPEEVERRVDGGRWRRWGPNVKVPFFDLGRSSVGIESPGRRTTVEAMVGVCRML